MPRVTLLAGTCAEGFQQDAGPRRRPDLTDMEVARGIVYMTNKAGASFQRS
jgi:hypothetical protein